MAMGPALYEEFSSGGTLLSSSSIPVQPDIVGSSDEESIHDETGKSRPARPVLHTRKVFDRRLTTLETYQVGNGNNAQVTGPGAHWLSWGAYGDIAHSNIQVTYSKSDESLVREALNKFYSTNQVDTLLNAVESPELVTSIRPFFNKINGVRIIDKDFDRRDIRKFLRNATNIIGVLSGGFLYYTFGVAPLISDMRKISKAVKVYNQHIQTSLRKKGTVSTVHSSCDGKISDVLLTPWPYGYGTVSGNGTSYWSTKIYDQGLTKKICTVRGVRTKKFQTDLFGRLDDLADRFGATGPASFAWERIPFSFVLDWFIDLSGILNKLDNALTGNTKQVMDVCLSTKWKALVQVNKHLYNTNRGSSYDGQQMALNELSYYNRQIRSDRPLVGLSDRFGKKQGFITGALIAGFGASLAKKKLAR